MRAERLKYNCKFPSCTSQYRVGRRNKHFYQFPSNPAQCMKWKEFCNISGNTDTSYFRLCEDHFKESDFWNQDKKRIKCGTVPALPEFFCIHRSTSPSDSVKAENNGSANHYEQLISSTVDNDHNYCIFFSEVPLDHDYLSNEQYNRTNNENI